MQPSDLDQLSHKYLFLWQCFEVFHGYVLKIILTEIIRSPNDSELGTLSEKGTVNIYIYIFM